MSKHALLSASSSHRWLNCPPSARLCESYEDVASDYAQQGTDAHSLCEYKLKKALEIKAKNPTKSLSYYDEEMENCAESYAEYVIEQYMKAKNNCSDPLVLIEQRLDFSNYVPEGFGTGDCVIVADNTLSVIDYKHGQGVLVEAENNPQMMCYALGALELFDGIYDIENINMTIFQPRRENVSTYSISKTELLNWANDVLKPTAELAYNGGGEFKAGEHCRFCKAKATCRKRAEYNLLLAKYEFELPSQLEDAEIEVILSKADELVSWVTDVKEYALQSAIGGKKWTDWKLVEGRSNRKYVNENTVAETVKAEGYDPYEHKVLGVTAMTKLLGKAKFEELLGGLIEKPQGKPTLVIRTDKRPEINTVCDDFKEEI
jgi:hypothetical protein